MSKNKAVCVWLDSTSDASAPTWIVSHDSLDERGAADTTTTLSTHDSLEEAIEEGRAKAAKLGLPLYHHPEDGPTTELASAEMMRMQAMLLRHGSKFSGNNVEDEAENWADQGFDADDADDWCEIGVWDAATAAEFRGAGLTPEKVKTAAESLTEGLDDPADEYTDGDPIYAACNGDIKVSVIIEAAE